MHKLKLNSYLKIIFLVSLISLISAYFIEYVLGHQPCNLCLIQRVPYGLSIILIFLNFIFNKNGKFIFILLILIFIFSLLLSFYHFGIETGFFEESNVCGIKNSTNIITKDELLRQLQTKTISCKDVTFKIMGLSLTSYNILISLLITITSVMIYLNYDKN